MDELRFTLSSPITEEEWDMIADVDFDNTESITFHTKHGKEVEFVKRKQGKWKTAYLEHEAMGVRPKVLYCSECNQCIAYPTNFCPNCGSYNGGEQE